MNEEVRTYLNQIKEKNFFAGEDMRGSLKFNIKWYRKKASLSHTCFRTVGFATVFLSVSLPFATAIGEPEDQARAVMLVSWLIALAGGANGFFQWGRTWQSRTEAYLRLERLLMEWEITVNNPNAKVENITLATKKLVNEARETIKSETGAFFEEVQFPDVKAPERNDN